MTDQPRLLFIIPTGFCFGLQNVTLAIAAEIAKRHPCHFLVSNWNNGEFPQRLCELNIPFTTAWLGMFSRKLNWRNLRMTFECLFKLPSAYLVFWKLYRQFRPTCIFLANHHEAILLWPALFWVRKKVVCHMHDPPPNLPFQRVSFRIWSKVVDRFICISESVRTRLHQLGRASSKDVVIYNGVTIKELTLPRQRKDLFVRRFNWPADSLIVGLTGQMTPTKGHEDFIAAAAIVAQKNVRTRFVIGGKEFEPYFSALKTLIAANRLHDIIRFSGWLERSIDFFSAIDLFVLASRHDEGFGLVLAEAGERGLPSVATRSGGATEIIVDEKSGVLVEKQNPQPMAGAIIKLLINDNRRQEMGLRAREQAVTHFNLSRQAEKLREFLAKV
jgi:glycosyltransferase involved in cell wall biosynthesis